MSVRTEVEDFILKEFYEGKSFDKLVTDWLETHMGTRKEAEQVIYKVLSEYALKY